MPIRLTKERLISLLFYLFYCGLMYYREGMPSLLLLAPVLFIFLVLIWFPQQLVALLTFFLPGVDCDNEESAGCILKIVAWGVFLLPMVGTIHSLITTGSLPPGFYSKLY